MTKITYDDKSYLNQNASVPNANKVCDSDMNEIKSVVNSNYDEMKDELYYKANDIIEIGATGGDTTYTTIGTLTGSTAVILFNITTSKRLDNINSISANNIQVVIRGINGNLNNNSNFTEYVGASGYTITTGISGSTSITIRITKSSAFTNGTNNTPVSLAGYIKLTVN